MDSVKRIRLLPWLTTRRGPKMPEPSTKLGPKPPFGRLERNKLRVVRRFEVVVLGRVPAPVGIDETSQLVPDRRSGRKATDPLRLRRTGRHLLALAHGRGARGDLRANLAQDFCGANQPRSFEHAEPQPGCDLRPTLGPHRMDASSRRLAELKLKGVFEDERCIMRLAVDLRRKSPVGAIARVDRRTPPTLRRGQQPQPHADVAVLKLVIKPALMLALNLHVVISSDRSR